MDSSALIKTLVKVASTCARSALRSLLSARGRLPHRLETKSCALWEGTTVVADRYLFTALARDAARGLPFDWLLNVYAPILWPDVVFYFAVSSETSGMRIAATREPKYYEAGQDITGIDAPHASYKQFISRVIREYEALALIFRFVTIDAERSINEHIGIRDITSSSAALVARIEREASPVAGAPDAPPASALRLRRNSRGRVRRD